jgi:hypothetical protein
VAVTVAAQRVMLATNVTIRVGVVGLVSEGV